MDAPLNPDPPKPPWYIQILTNTSIQGWIERLVVAGVLAFLTWRTGAIHTDVRENKDITTHTAEVQQKVVAVEVRGSAADVEALKATTQQTK